MIRQVRHCARASPDSRKAVWSERICICRNEQVDIIRVLRPQPVSFELFGSGASAEDSDGKERLVAEFVHVLERQCSHALRSSLDGERRLDENETAKGMRGNVGLGNECVQAVCTKERRERRGGLPDLLHEF